MHVAELMTTEVFAFSPDTSLETAARLLATRGISGAPVVSAEGRPLGVVAMTDLVDPDRKHSTREGYPLFYLVGPTSTKEFGKTIEVGEGCVADVMSPFVLSIDSSAPVTEAACRLVDEGVHRLLVMDDQKLVGILSSLDVLRGMVRQGG